MDTRWKPISRDSQRQVKVMLYPNSAIWEVRRQREFAISDGIDLSEFVKDVSHTVFEANVTLVFNRELFGPIQPKPNQILEIQLWQSNEWKSLWIGIVDSISSFTMSRGERQMQINVKTREQQDIWKAVKRVTPLYPQLTNMMYIVQNVARTCDMKGDEVALPPTAVMTAHSNTQMADMTAWDMVSSVFVSLGWTPFIDGQGRLRAADRTIQNRSPDILLADDRMIKVGGQRLRPPVSRVRVAWLNPELVRWEQQTRLLASVPITLGWYIKYHDEKVKFSEDGTQRAIANTPPKANPSAEKWSGLKWLKVTWIQQTPTGGKLHFDNSTNFNLYIKLAGIWATAVASQTFFGFSSGGVAIIQAGFLALLQKMGPGIYEIWGTPYDYVHARNVSEAFDDSVPEWVDNPLDISCDFIINEEHARAVAVRELIYSAWSASKWSVTIVDDPRIEYGDLLQFPDGSKFFVENFTRNLGRGDEAVLEVHGFLIGTAKATLGEISSEVSPPTGGESPPGGGGGGDGTPGSSADNPIIAMSADPAQIALDVAASYNHFNPIAISECGLPEGVGELSYWVGKASNPDIFSDSKWYLGHNKYWEDRMDCHNPGFPASADNSGGSKPAVYRA